MKVDLRAISEAARFDPAEPLWAAAGDLSDYEISPGLILVATYIPPPRTFKNEKGEDVVFHLSDKTIMEDRFQGKTGLVLKTGELVDNHLGIKPGDWIMFRPSDAMEVFMRDRRKSHEGFSARLLDARFVFMRVSDPSLIY